MKVVASTGAVALFAALLALGGSATASVAASRASASRSPIVAVATAAAPKYYLQQSGTGSKNLRAVALPSKWYLVWKFNCGAKKESFSLTSTKQGQSALAVARQTGLGGGGQRPFTKSGTYKFAIRTICAWQLSAVSRLPAAK